MYVYTIKITHKMYVYTIIITRIIVCSQIINYSEKHQNIYKRNIFQRTQKVLCYK